MLTKDDNVLHKPEFLRGDGIKRVMADRPTSYEYADLLTCGRGQLFGPGNAQLPLPPMLMFERIASISEAGGAHGKGQIVGITEDFHNDNLRLDIEPMIFMYSENIGFHYYIKVSGQTPLEATVSQIDAVFKKHNPDYPFEFTFLEEVFDREYRSEQVIGKLAMAFMVVAILISGLGLFGLASFTAERRTKEMGIRKVLGASAGSLSILLCGDFALLVATSLLIGFPIAWYFIDQFLSGFRYHTEIHWTLYLLTAILMLGLTFLSVGYHTLKTAWSNPVNSLQNEG